MGGIKIVGIEKLQRKLKKNVSMAKVRTTVQKNGDQLNDRMKENTETAFTKGYSEGDTAGSINTVITDGGMTAEVEPTTDYSAMSEYHLCIRQNHPQKKTGSHLLQCETRALQIRFC